VPAGTNPGFFGYGLLEYLDESRLPSLAAATRSAGAWNVPTLVLIENRFTAETPDQIAARPEMRYMPPPVVKQWVDGARSALAQAPADAVERGRRFVALRRRIVRALRDAGAGLLLGADTPQVFNVPGFATLQELEALVAAGLTPFEALEAGTRNPAASFGLDASFGTVEVGKRADLLLVDADPLADVRNVRKRAGVMVAGRWLTAAEIETRLKELAVP
jgi:imidazolonepropionase-like amidohydrolase